MVPDRIERELLIDAPVDVVWAIVTQPEHVGSWFSDSAEIDLRPGGDAILTWDEFGTVRARIEKVEPPHTFSFRWARGTDIELVEGTSTLVEFNLSPEGDGTRLRVVESGFAQLDRTPEEQAKYAAENTHGWKVELGELSDYVAKQAQESARR